MDGESRLRTAREALAGLVPRAYDGQVGHARLVERASDRKIRERNKISYRLNHWPIWIWTFFIAPGPLTFDLFAHGFDRRMAAWLGIVLAGTGIAGLFGKLPGVEPAPYIIRFTEDKPNPLYRRICYTFAWSAVDHVRGAEHRRPGLGDRDRRVAAAPDLRRRLLPRGGHHLGCSGCSACCLASRRSTKNEGHERRYFYGSVWAVCVAQPVLWLMWVVLPRGGAWDVFKLAVFVGILAYVGNLARRGLLPRTRPIVPGEIAVSD